MRMWESRWPRFPLRHPRDAATAHHIYSFSDDARLLACYTAQHPKPLSALLHDVAVILRRRRRATTSFVECVYYPRFSVNQTTREDIISGDIYGQTELECRGLQGADVQNCARPPKRQANGAEANQHERVLNCVGIILYWACV